MKPFKEENWTIKKKRLNIMKKKNYRVKKNK